MWVKAAEIDEIFCGKIHKKIVSIAFVVCKSEYNWKKKIEQANERVEKWMKIVLATGKDGSRECAKKKNWHEMESLIQWSGLENGIDESEILPFRCARALEKSFISTASSLSCSWIRFSMLKPKRQHFSRVFFFSLSALRTFVRSSSISFYIFHPFVHSFNACFSSSSPFNGLQESIAENG